MRCLSILTKGGGEIQVNEYKPGEKHSAEDRDWDGVAYKPIGGFHFPNTELGEDVYKSIMRRFAFRRPKDDIFGPNFVGDMSDELLVIAEARQEAATPPQEAIHQGYLVKRIGAVISGLSKL
jgi:hypothetical protein